MGKSTGRQSQQAYRRRRRHSSYHPTHWALEPDNYQLLVSEIWSCNGRRSLTPLKADRFLQELSRRLDFLESYGQLNFDATYERAWSTLHDIRDACSRVSDGVMDAGRRRASILVETLEDRYKEALATKETLDAKVQEGVKFMDSILTTFETHAYAMKDSPIGVAASSFLENQKARMDEGLQRAKETFDEGLNAARQAAESFENAIASALAKAKEKGLITYYDLPYPWRVNEHIVRGYRFHERKIDCLRSALTLSNELFNIWSHVIGLVIVLSIAFYFYPSTKHFSLSSKSDIFIASLFFFAAAKCLVCSTMWHTFNSISHQTLMERFACVDYTGISLLVAASIMTTEYTAFYCEPASRWFWISTTFALGVAGTILPWHPTFNRADMSWVRVAFYVGLAMTGGLPVLQLMWARGTASTLYFYAPIMRSLLVYLGGAILYACKVPERWFPGCFDYVGGSHNIWHIAVLGGILFHYGAMKEFFEVAFRRRVESCSVY